MCLLDHAYEVLLGKNQNGMLKVARKAFNIGRSGTHYVAMETELLSFHNGAHLVESYCKKTKQFCTNWLRYMYLNYHKFIEIWLSVRRHHLANLHILKT